MSRQRRNRKEEILQTAAEQFALHGYHGATLSKIAEAVDLTEPGLLHYFPNKEQLLQEVLDYRDQQDLAKYQVLLEDKHALLFEVLQDLVEANQRKPGLVQLFTVMVGESINPTHPSHDFFVNRYQIVKDMMIKYLQAYCKQEGLRENVDLTQLTVLIIAIMDGLQIQWLLDQENFEMTAAFRLFTKMMQAYLGDKV